MSFSTLLNCIASIPQADSFYKKPRSFTQTHCRGTQRVLLPSPGQILHVSLSLCSVYTMQKAFADQIEDSNDSGMISR